MGFSVRLLICFNLVENLRDEDRVDHHDVRRDDAVSYTFYTVQQSVPPATSCRIPCASPSVPRSSSSSPPSGHQSAGGAQDAVAVG